MKTKIYFIPADSQLSKDVNMDIIFNWNEAECLPELAIEFMRLSKEIDLCYNPYNFVTDFNLNESPDSDNYWCYIPDEKFKNEIEKLNL